MHVSCKGYRMACAATDLLLMLAIAVGGLVRTELFSQSAIVFVVTKAYNKPKATVWTSAS
jgi:hypothetical protein